jgi:hypothetical protein
MVTVMANGDGDGISPISGGEILTAQGGLACFILFNYLFSLLK